MAVGMAAAESNQALTDLSGVYTFIQLHIGDPGAAGTANIATETRRMSVTWNAPAGGSMDNGTAATWTDVPALEDFTHFSAWSASTSGTFGFSGLVTASAVVAGDTFSIPAGGATAAITTAA